jgi:nucleoside-diphosphate-sugar epimerase
VLAQFGYVDDLANLIILAIENDRARGQSYNFAGKYMRPLDDYVRVCAAAVSAVEGGEYTADVVHYWPEQAGLQDKDIGGRFPYRWRVNTVREISKARYELGYEEKTSLDQGLVESAKWYFGEIAEGRRPFPQPDYSEEDRILKALGR